MNGLGERLRAVRRERSLTQREVAEAIGVSEQAVSKWENSAVLPDVYHLRLLAELLRVSADHLLGLGGERIVSRIPVGETAAELVERPETLLAGRILRAGDYADFDGFDRAIGGVTVQERQEVFAWLRGVKLPARDIRLSVNFWLPEARRAYGFVREVTEVTQTAGVDVYRMPPCLYLRMYNDRAAARLIAREKCEMWELFAYMRDYLMPAHGLMMADNGAQEMEICDSAERGTGWACIPVQRRDR